MAKFRQIWSHWLVNTSRVILCVIVRKSDAKTSESYFCILTYSNRQILTRMRQIHFVNYAFLQHMKTVVKTY